MTKSLVQQQFGANAAKYAVSPVHAKGQSLHQLVARVRAKPHWHALDIATGTGFTALALAKHVAHVTGCDVTPEMLDEARKLAKARGTGNVTFEAADAEALPYEAARFDLVTCRIAPHHFRDPLKFVSEAARVLKPGGIFGLVDNMAPDESTIGPCAEAEIAEAGVAFDAFERLRDPSHIHCLTLQAWTQALHAGGLTITHAAILQKDTQFCEWVGRMSTSVGRQRKMLDILNDDTSWVARHLRPENVDGTLWLTHWEVLLIARKPG